MKKKHNAIAYHRVREAIAARLIRFCHIDSKINVADVLTKPLDNQTFHHVIRSFLFRNPGEPRWPPEHKVLSVFDPPTKDPSVQTPSASVSEQPSEPSAELAVLTSTDSVPISPDLESSSTTAIEIERRNYKNPRTAPQNIGEPAEAATSHREKFVRNELPAEPAKATHSFEFSSELAQAIAEAAPQTESTPSIEQLPDSTEPSQGTSEAVVETEAPIALPPSVKFFEEAKRAQADQKQAEENAKQEAARVAEAGEVLGEDSVSVETPAEALHAFAELFRRRDLLVLRLVVVGDEEVLPAVHPG